ncbi:unnamed protein product [marine sediment metagenome]|uniref:Uncharacterized protein n=1 Tax=marine sediment metagenome TaxID=412755 RepID=X1M6P0_9ZZZZ
MVQKNLKFNPKKLEEIFGTSLVLQEFLAVIANKKPVLVVTFFDRSQKELVN